MAPHNSKVLEKLCQRQTLSQNRLNKFHIVKFNSIINSVEIKVSLSKQHGVFTRNLASTVNGEPECRYAKVYRGVALEALLRALDSAYYRVCHRVKNQKKHFFSSAPRVSPARHVLTSSQFWWSNLCVNFRLIITSVKSSRPRWRPFSDWEETKAALPKWWSGSSFLWSKVRFRSLFHLIGYW